MAGSGGGEQVGLRLLVPACVLLLPLVMLGAGLISLTAAASQQAPVAELIPPPPEFFLDPTEVAALPFEPPPPTETPIPEATPQPLAVSTPSVPRITPTATPTWDRESTFTFVALGVDQRNEREIPRTDTIMIGKVDVRVPRVNLISIPRDLLVDIPGYGKDRINTAYVYGVQFKEPDGGIGLLRRTIEKNLGVRIDHFGLVDFQCFRTAVDAVGGVTVNVPRAIVDPRYPTEDYGYKLVKFDPGIQRMDGERALEYARTRNADNDFHRIQRQQLIMAALREQVFQLRSLPAVPTVLGGCRNMQSDLGWRDYLSLAGSLRSMDSSRVSFSAIDEKMTTDTILSSGAQVLLPRWEPIRLLVGESFGLPARQVGPFASPVASPGVFASPSPSPFPLPEKIANPNHVDPVPGDADTPTLGSLRPAR